VWLIVVLCGRTNMLGAVGSACELCILPLRHPCKICVTHAAPCCMSTHGAYSSHLCPCSGNKIWVSSC
jgi:hypothetical protein